MARYQDIAGQTFGRLTAKTHAGRTKTGQALWLFTCECGGEKTAQASEVRRGKTRSCGCLAAEQKRAAGKAREHAFSRASMYHERKSWESMLARCYNPAHVSYKCYGAVGITVCDQWRASFEAFARDMGARPADKTLDRINNSKGYSPENCQWSDKIEQANNRKTNRRITLGDTTKTVAQWARHYGIAQYIIHARLYQGWSEHDAVTLPVGAIRAYR